MWHTIYDDYLFPQKNNDLCPEPIMRLSLLQHVFSFLNNNPNNHEKEDDFVIHIRNPILFLHAIVGCILGLYGTYRLSFFSKTLSSLSSSSSSSSFVRQSNNNNNKSNNNKSNKNDDDDDNNDNDDNHYLLWWRISFFFFGLMNLVAIPLHSLVPLENTGNEYESQLSQQQQQQQSQYLPQLYPCLWMCDTFFTGSSSCAIIIACWNNYQQDKKKKKGVVTTTNSTTREWKYYGMMQSVGLICVVIFFLPNNDNDNNNDNKWWKTIPLELWYLLPTVLAAHTTVALLRYEMRNYSYHEKNDMYDRKQSTTTTTVVVAVVRTWIPIILLSLAGFLVGGGFLVDAWICQNMHILPYGETIMYYYSYDGFMVSSITFAACNIAFAGLYYRLHYRHPQLIQEQEQQQQGTKAITRKGGKQE